MPVVKRRVSSVVTSERRLATAVRRTEETAAVLAAGVGVYSSRVFHCPQAGQRPAHLGVSLPQLEQRKTVLDFIGFLQILQHAAADGSGQLLLIGRVAQEPLLLVI